MTPAFFPFNGNAFFNEILHSGWWKRIFWLVETLSFVQRFFLLVETVTEISESQFLRKEHILTNVTDFLASGNQLLPLSQTTSIFSDSNQLLLVEALFPLNGT